MEEPTRFELVLRVLQTHALPLGYGSIIHNMLLHKAILLYYIFLLMSTF